MAEKDIWERFERMSGEITEIKVQIAKLQVQIGLFALANGSLVVIAQIVGSYIKS